MRNRSDYRADPRAARCSRRWPGGGILAPLGAERILAEYLPEGFSAASLVDGHYAGPALSAAGAPVYSAAGGPGDSAYVTYGTLASTGYVGAYPASESMSLSFVLIRRSTLTAPRYFFDLRDNVSGAPRLTCGWHPPTNQDWGVVVDASSSASSVLLPGTVNWSALVFSTSPGLLELAVADPASPLRTVSASPPGGLEPFSNLLFQVRLDAAEIGTVDLAYLGVVRGALGAAERAAISGRLFARFGIRLL